MPIVCFNTVTVEEVELEIRKLDTNNGHTGNNRPDKHFVQNFDIARPVLYPIINRIVYSMKDLLTCHYTRKEQKTNGMQILKRIMHTQIADISKAFDTINYELLIARIHAYGLTNPTR